MVWLFVCLLSGRQRSFLTDQYNLRQHGEVYSRKTKLAVGTQKSYASLCVLVYVYVCGCVREIYLDFISTFVQTKFITFFFPTFTWKLICRQQGMDRRKKQSRFWCMLGCSTSGRMITAAMTLPLPWTSRTSSSYPTDQLYMYPCCSTGSERGRWGIRLLTCMCV